jgi:ankyrin repeat protein
MQYDMIIFVLAHLEGTGITGSDSIYTLAARTRHRRNALHYACEEGRDQVVKVLLASGTNSFARVGSKALDDVPSIVQSSVQFSFISHGPVLSSLPRLS